MEDIIITKILKENETRGQKEAKGKQNSERELPTGKQRYWDAVLPSDNKVHCLIERSLP